MLEAIAAAVTACAGERLSRRFLHDRVPEIARHAWEHWGRRLSEYERVAAIERLARRRPREVRDEARTLAARVAGNLSKDDRERLTLYLSVVPSKIRLTNRRLADPGGRTVPYWLSPGGPEELARFLPSAIPMLAPGQTPWPSADWELTDLLGVGGYGEVWKGSNPQVPGLPPVVFKFCTSRSSYLYAFRHEAAVLTQVMRGRRASGVVPLRITALDLDPPCLAFEYIEGGDMVQWLNGRARAKKRLRPETITRIVARLARVVARFHRLERPIVHRDLKPANVLVRRNARGRLELMITDFGISAPAGSTPPAVAAVEDGREARLIQSDRVRRAFTAHYASPQQMRGKPPTPRDDVYSLGVIWYQLLIGDLTASAPQDMTWAKTLADAGLSAAQAEFVGNCMSARTDLRPADAGEMLKGVRRLFGEWLKPTPRKRERKRRRRRRTADGSSRVAIPRDSVHYRIGVVGEGRAAGPAAAEVRGYASGPAGLSGTGATTDSGFARRERGRATAALAGEPATEDGGDSRMGAGSSSSFGPAGGGSARGGEFAAFAEANQATEAEESPSRFGFVGRKPPAGLGGTRPLGPGTQAAGPPPAPDGNVAEPVSISGSESPSVSGSLAPGRGREEGAPPVWRRMGDDLGLGSMTSERREKIRMLLLALERLGRDREGFAKQFEAALGRGLIGRELVWELERLGRGASAEAQLARSLARKTFGEPLPPLGDAAGEDPRVIEIRYRRWLDRVAAPRV